MPKACIPVSYTHLDVYKRQVPWRGRGQNPPAGGRRKSAGYCDRPPGELVLWYVHPGVHPCVQKMCIRDRPSTRQHPPRNSGSRLGRSIWTDEACQKASAGESLYWQSTGAVSYTHLGSAMLTALCCSACSSSGSYLWSAPAPS